MKHLEDKRVCPSCGHEYHEHRYLMSASPDRQVLSVRAGLWVLVAVFVFLVVVAHAA